jgi:hypothetical protein
MSNGTYRRLWRELLEKDHADLAEILSHDDLFEDWGRDHMPEVAAEEELHAGLDLLYGDVDPKMANQYLKRCIAVANRALAEDKFRKSRWCKAGFPENRGQAERVRQYARALLGQHLNTEALLSAADDIVQYFRQHADWPDSHTQARWLGAVRMTFVAGKPGRALKLVEEAGSLEWHQKEADLLAVIAREAVVAQPVRNDKLLQRLDRIFDKVRSPRWHGPAKVFNEPDEQRLELGVIRYKYFVSKDRSIDWDAVIESIRR